MKRQSNETPSQPIDSAVPEVPDGVLQAALNGVVAESLRSAVAGLGVFLLVFGGAHFFLPVQPVGRIWIIALALASAAVMGGGYVALRRGSLPIEWVHPVGMGIIFLAVINVLLRYYWTGDNQQVAYLALLFTGAGFILISTRWLAFAMVTSVATWGVVTSITPFPFNWLDFFLLLGGVTLAAIVHVARRRSAIRLERLRIRDARYKAELEEVLKTTEEAQRSLATGIAVGQRIVSILDLDVLLSQVAYLIQQRFNCHFVGVFLLDESGEYLVFRAGTGEVGRSLTEQKFHLKVGVEGIIGWTAKYRRPACVDDVSKDERFLAHESIPTTRSELALPLEMGTTLLGVLDMESEHLATFREDDVPFLQLLADQVATAIQNASLYEKEKNRRHLAETLYQVGRALSGTLNLAEEFDLILEMLSNIVPYDRAAVMLRSGDELEFAASRGFPLGFEHYRIGIKKGDIFEEVYRTRKPLAISDIAAQRADWVQADGLPQTRAWLGIPLIRSTEVLGMLSLARETPNAYTEEDVTLAATFAGQAAIALHNARLYDQITRFSQDLEKLVQQRTEALQQAYNDLERMDRAKSDFIGVASHELRTPLTLLRGYSQMLLDDPTIKNNPLLYQQINGIQTGAIRLHEIVESMLDVAKIDNRELQLHPVPLQIPSLIRSIYEALEPAMNERDLRFSDHYQTFPSIEGDLEALRKVFYQLIVNAIKFTPDGGRISVSGHSLETGERGMLDGGVEIIVSDTGIGIAPHLQELIFYKFYQTGELALHSTGKTKFKGGGPGLGLAIAKGIVEAHNGKLWVESPGFDEKTCPGSQFHIVLPIHQKATYVH